MAQTVTPIAVLRYGNNLRTIDILLLNIIYQTKSISVGLFVTPAVRKQTIFMRYGTHAPTITFKLVFIIFCSKCIKDNRVITNFTK